MSRLPQHKKSSEELAKLRESLGIPVQPPVSDSFSTIVSAPLADAPMEIYTELPGVVVSLESELQTAPSVTNVPESSVITPIPIPELPVKQLRSLRRSDRHPQSPVGNDPQLSSISEVQTLPVSSGPLQSSPPRAVHSLRKSEQVPLSRVRSSSGDSGLPSHRHTPEQIREIRRQEVLAMQKMAAEQGTHKAHWIVVSLGYVFALTAMIGCYYYQFVIYITGICLACSFLVACFLLIRKPYSRHHAAFIGVISLLITIFSVLYYFPQLRYGT